MRLYVVYNKQCAIVIYGSTTTRISTQAVNRLSKIFKIQLTFESIQNLYICKLSLMRIHTFARARSPVPIQNFKSKCFWFCQKKRLLVIVVNINANVQYQFTGIHCFKRELRFFAFSLALCRCESELMEPAYRNFYSSSFAQPLPEAQRLEAMYAKVYKCQWIGIVLYTGINIDSHSRFCWQNQDHFWFAIFYRRSRL